MEPLEDRRLLAIDFGDAPIPYSTLLSDDGARHEVLGPRLGTLVDAEVDGQPSLLADGDDFADSDDEDGGVVFTSTIVPGEMATLDATATATGKLDGWIDFNADGDWADIGERIFDGQALIAGTNGLSFVVPGDAVVAPQTFARFRISSAGGLSVVGATADGEVEDYAVAVGPVLSVTLPAGAWETDGVLADAGTVTISGTLDTDLVVSLTSDDSGELVVPATATIVAGQTSATFDLTAGDDVQQDGAQTVSVTATAVGFNSGSQTMVVRDDEVHHFTFDPISTPQTGSEPFGVTVRVRNLDGENILPFEGKAILTGMGNGGAVPVSPSTTSRFTAGVWTGAVRVDAVDTGVILTARDGLGNAGTSSAFDVVPGTIDHLEWDAVESPQHVGISFEANITALDANGYTVTNVNSMNDLSGWVSVGTSSTIVITECRTDSSGFVEVQNVAGRDIDTAGWILAASDSLDDINQVRSRHFWLPSTTEDAEVIAWSKSNVGWSDLTWKEGEPGWAMIVDDAGNLVDFVAWGWNAAQIRAMNVTVLNHAITIGDEFSGDGVVPARVIYRQGDMDLSTAADFAYGTSSSGASQNPGLTVPFASRINEVAISPTAATLTGGVWSGQVTISELAVNMHLHTDDGAGQIAETNTFDVSPVPLLSVDLPMDAVEGAGVLVGQGQVRIPVPRTEDLVVSLCSGDPSSEYRPADHAPVENDGDPRHYHAQFACLGSRKHGYQPNSLAITAKLVLEQADALCTRWAECRLTD